MNALISLIEKTGRSLGKSSEDLENVLGYLRRERIFESVADFRAALFCPWSSPIVRLPIRLKLALKSYVDWPDNEDVGLDSPPPNLLPAGWHKQWSSEFGAQYYLNIHTGVSQWERPSGTNQFEIENSLVIESAFAHAVSRPAPATRGLGHGPGLLLVTSPRPSRPLHVRFANPAEIGSPESDGVDVDGGIGGGGGGGESPPSDSPLRPQPAPTGGGAESEGADEYGPDHGVRERLRVSNWRPVSAGACFCDLSTAARGDSTKQRAEVRLVPSGEVQLRGLLLCRRSTALTSAAVTAMHRGGGNGIGDTSDDCAELWWPLLELPSDCAPARELFFTLDTVDLGLRGWGAGATTTASASAARVRSMRIRSGISGVPAGAVVGAAATGGSDSSADAGDEIHPSAVRISVSTALSKVPVPSAGTASSPVAAVATTAAASYAASAGAAVAAVAAAAQPQRLLDFAEGVVVLRLLTPVPAGCVISLDSLRWSVGSISTAGSVVEIGGGRGVGPGTAGLRVGSSPLAIEGLGSGLSESERSIHSGYSYGGVELLNRWVDLPLAPGFAPAPPLANQPPQIMLIGDLVRLRGRVLCADSGCAAGSDITPSLPPILAPPRNVLSLLGGRCPGGLRRAHGAGAGAVVGVNTLATGVGETSGDFAEVSLYGRLLVLASAAVLQLRSSMQRGDEFSLDGVQWSIARVEFGEGGWKCLPLRPPFLAPQQLPVRGSHLAAAEGERWSQPPQYRRVWLPGSVHCIVQLRGMIVVGGLSSGSAVVAASEHEEGADAWATICQQPDLPTDVWPPRSLYMCCDASEPSSPAALDAPYRHNRDRGVASSYCDRVSDRRASWYTDGAVKIAILPSSGRIALRHALCTGARLSLDGLQWQVE